jgi:hypothetical protein
MRQLDYSITERNAPPPRTSDSSHDYACYVKGSKSIILVLSCRRWTGAELLNSRPGRTWRNLGRLPSRHLLYGIRLTTMAISYAIESRASSRADHDITLPQTVALRCVPR